jgi:ESS family glutamate:Na+ symporter
VLSTIGAILQNILGIGIAILLGQPALFGVLCGSVSLTGGPATGLAFAPQFERAGVPAAEEVAIAAAIFGIIAAGLIGAPIATVLIRRLQRRKKGAPEANEKTIEETTEQLSPTSKEVSAVEDHVTTYQMHKSVALLLLSMWIGSWVSAWLTTHVMTLPIYMGGMLTAAVIRNIDDLSGCFGLSQRTLDIIGSVALSFFLSMALMTLELWKLAAIAMPMFVILSLQVTFMVVYSVWPIFVCMGRNYDAAITAGGFFGYMIGITANAIASMDSVVKRYGPAPVAYLVVPLVGAFFIDFTNAVLIQGCLNLLK